MSAIYDVIKPIIDLIWTAFLCWTGKILIQVFSFGKIEIAPELTEKEKKKRSNSAKTRNEHGQLIVNDDQCHMVGLIFWCVIGLLTLLLLIKYLS